MSDPAIDLAWIAACFGRDPHTLEAAEWNAIGTGQVAASYRGKLHWHDDAQSGDGDLPATIVVKAPSENPVSRSVGHSMHLYARELHWYGTLRGRSKINCPASFGQRFNPQDSDFLLGLADCVGASQGDQINGAKADDVAAAITELAHLHAAFFNDPAIASDPLTQRNLDSARQSAAMYAQFWPEFAKRYAGRIDAELLQVGADLVPKIENLLCRESEMFTLGHGDFRLDNLLFPATGGRVFVLDWQTIGQQCPMVDLAYLIGTSFADPRERQIHEAALLAQYFDALRAADTAFDEAVLRHEYKLRALTGIVMAVASSMLVARTQRGDEMFAMMFERPARHALEVGSIALL